jgi:glycosyltransferase involved in cell wall biosynthesis
VPIRVCFIIDNLSRAGTEMQLLQLLRHFDREKLSPYLCLLDGTSDISRELEPTDVPLIRLGVKRCVSLHGLRQAFCLRSFLTAHNIDVVQTYFTDSTRFSAPIARATGVQAVVGAYRNAGHWSTRRDAWIGRVYHRLFLDYVIANCAAAGRVAVELDGAVEDRVTVIANGIDLTPFLDIPAWVPHTPRHSPKVGMVGNLRPVKGVDIFITAAARILRHYPDTVFEIAGGGDARDLGKLATRLGIDKKVRLIGPITDVPRFLSSLDVAVLPSRSEGMSNAILEYMAAGRPIVATDVGGTRELIRSSETGELVVPESPDALADGVIALLEHPERAKALAYKARETALAEHSMTLAAMRHTDFYVSLCTAHVSAAGA